MTASPDARAAQVTAPHLMAPPAHPTLGSIILLGTLTAIGALSIDLYLPSLPAIGRDFVVDAATVQRTMSAFFIGMAIGQIAYGPMSDRFGRRPALLVGLVSICLPRLAARSRPPSTGWLPGGSRKRWARAPGRS